MAALDCAILVFALSAIFLVIDLAVLLIAARRRKEAFNTFAALSSSEKGSRQISSSKLGGTALALNLILAISHVSIILLGIVYLFAESPNSFFLPLLGFFFGIILLSVGFAAVSFSLFFLGRRQSKEAFSLLGK